MYDEAKRIGEFLKIKPAQLPERDFEEIRRAGQGFHGVPCPFLKKGRCGVYEVRPMACRAHHSLDDTPAQCDLSIPSEKSSVPSYSGFRVVVLSYSALHIGNGPLGDIREFFPNLPKGRI